MQSRKQYAMKHGLSIAKIAFFATFTYLVLAAAVAAALLLIAFPADQASAGTIYKWRDASGVLHYSNRPEPGAKPYQDEVKFDPEAHQRRLEVDGLRRQIGDLEDRLDDMREMARRPVNVTVRQAPAQAPVIISGSGQYRYSWRDYDHYRRRGRTVIVKPPAVPYDLQRRRYLDRRTPYYQRHKGPSAAEINERLGR